MSFSASYGRAVLGQPAQCEVGLEVGRPVVDGADPAGEGLGEGVGVEQLGERRRRVEVGHDDRSGHHLALAQLDAADRAALDDDARHLGVAAQLAPVLLEQPARWSAMVPRPPRTFDMVAVPGEASAKARQRALPGERAPGRWS